MTDNNLRFRNIAVSAARLADAKKAEAVLVYDMAGRSELADYIVVITVDNPAQMDAVDDEITINLKKEGVYAIYRDGMKSKNWKVLDYGGIIIHIFEKQAREFYSFDNVYAGYKIIKWEEKPAVKPVPQAASRRKAAPKKAATKAAPKKAERISKKAKAAPKKAKKAGKVVKKTPARKTAQKKKAVKKTLKKKRK